MLFGRKKTTMAYDIDQALLRVLDDARAAGCSARRIAEAFQSRADSVRQSMAVSQPWSGHVPQQYDGYGRPIVR
jgi:hypothetical protein